MFSSARAGHLNGTFFMAIVIPVNTLLKNCALISDYTLKVSDKANIVLDFYLEDSHELQICFSPLEAKNLISHLGATLANYKKMVESI